MGYRGDSFDYSGNSFDEGEGRWGEKGDYLF